MLCILRSTCAGLLLFAWGLQAAAGAVTHVVVVLDDSGSMDERMRAFRGTTKMEAAKMALVSVLETLPEDTQTGVVLLNGRLDGSGWVVPLGPMDLPRTRQALQSVRARGGTPLGEFMKVGADALLEMRGREHYGNYRLLIVTDGEAGDQHLVDQYLPDILSRGIILDVIGVDMASDHSLATQVHSYRRADDPESLTRAIREVFAETAAAPGSDAQAEDFAFLEGISSEVAEAALAALAASGDQPIGVENGSAEATPQGSLPGSYGVPASGQGPTPQDADRVAGESWSWLLLILLLVIVLNVARAFIRTVRRG